ncbi:hypothetical protein ALC62_11198 [Cyphomyrmex costatus]|uniref:Peptidase aspartic putative domain-containing protein n=1 Tax=Cyphomyrmex costatus TaxID=456900 RepID=A0A151ICN6_9HYME|nr:hypothetical protein ALC62_11198 [Cyphomyrmex costatus]
MNAREIRNADNHGLGNATNAVNKIKLPPINLPTFDGLYDRWPNFRDTFRTVIDENSNLTDIKKLYYLKLALKGVAAEILESMELSADNYDVAWNILESRFENKRVLVHHHLQALVEFPVMQKESSTGLRQLLDHTEKHVRALKKLGEPTDQWGTILVYLTTAKFDNTTKREWETKTSAREVATYMQFIEFTTNRCVMLETLKLDKSKGAKLSSSDTSHKSSNANKKAIAAVTAEAKSDKCLACNQGNHRLYHCPSFLNLAPPARSKEVKRLKLCFNCFKGDHSVESCNASTCRVCHKKHNTLLHIPKDEGTEHGSGIKLHDERSLRAFRPSTEKEEINKNHLQIPETITLADPSFHIPGRIDVLLGGSIFWELLCVGQIKLGKNQPIAQKTKLCWIIAGPINFKGYNESSIASVSSISAITTIETQLERFWQIEECNVQLEASENDKLCESEFDQTHRRNAAGRFEV